MGDVACRGVQVGQGGMEVGHGAGARGQVGVRVGIDLVATGAGMGVCVTLGVGWRCREWKGNNTPKREISSRRKSGQALAQRLHGILRPFAIARNHPLADDFSVDLAFYCLKLDPSPKSVPGYRETLWMITVTCGPGGPSELISNPNLSAKPSYLNHPEIGYPSSHVKWDANIPSTHTHPNVHSSPLSRKRSQTPITGE